MNGIAEVETGIIEIVAPSPDTFIAQAIGSGADVAVLTSLYELKQKYDADEARKAFYEAMAKFQNIRPELKRTSDVKFKNTEYSFCGLTEIEKTIKEPLFQCELSTRYENVYEGDREGLSCIVTHVLGHSEKTTLFAPPDDSGNKNSIQSIGSRNTYLQRYTLVSALSLTSADEDDDGVSSGDMPYAKLLAHNEAVRENLMMIMAMKESIAAKDYGEVAMYLYELEDEAWKALWVAPLFGGIFTTKERTFFQSDELGVVRREYLASKGETK